MHDSKEKTTGASAIDRVSINGFSMIIKKTKNLDFSQDH